MGMEVSRRDLLAVSAGIAGVAAVGGTIWSSEPALAKEAPARGHQPVLEPVVLGNIAAETKHHIASTLSSVVAGERNQTARVLNPTSPAGYWGGTVRFTL